jgi:hypothetical protein
MHGLMFELRLVLKLALLFLTMLGCASQSPNITASKISKMAGLKAGELRGGDFVLRVYYRFDSPGSILRVYLEGDGRAWLTNSRASRNPSPQNPVGLNLAARDPGKNILYIARPCQYVSFDNNPKCEYPYWTHKRFAPEIIDSVSAVIDLGKENAQANELELIGFSGGGAVAVLVSARRSDVSRIRTVAGNLDHKAWTQHHKVDALRGSLNAANVAKQIAHIPQIHYVGAEDKNMGRYVAESFSSKAGRDACIKIETIAGATHSKGWNQVWPDLIAEATPDCL